MTEEKEVWLRAWCAVASDPGCIKSDVASKWADDCLKAFKERFVAVPFVNDGVRKDFFEGEINERG